MEYPLWEVYTDRLIEAGVDERAAREIVDMLVNHTVNDNAFRQGISEVNGNFKQQVNELNDNFKRQITELNDNFNQQVSDLEKRMNVQREKELLQLWNKILVAVLGLGGTILVGGIIAIVRNGFL